MNNEETSWYKIGFIFPPEIKFENEKSTDEPHAKESPKDGSVVFSPSGLRCHVYDLTAHLFRKYCILRKRDFQLKKVKIRLPAPK